MTGLEWCVPEHLCMTDKHNMPSLPLTPTLISREIDTVRRTELQKGQRLSGLMDIRDVVHYTS